MSNLILRTAPALGEGDIEVLNFSVVVQDADWVGQFDQLQVYRSTQGSSGPFEELTAESWASPRLPATGGPIPGTPVTGPLVNIVGNELLLEANQQLITVTFTGSDPLTYAQVASQITVQSGGRLYSYVDATGQIVIEVTYPGTRSRLELLPSDGAVLLGLDTVEPGNSSQGRDPRPSLVQGQTTYEVEDGFGSREYFYRTRFINSSSGETSDFSISFSGKGDVGVGVDNTIIGYVELADVDGRSMPNVEVRVYSDFDGKIVGGKLIAGVGSVGKTDEHGRVEFLLVRGKRLTVSVQGTGLARTITVPTDASLSMFDLFDPTIGDIDVFRAAVPNIITAERRTL